MVYDYVRSYKSADDNEVYFITYNPIKIGIKNTFRLQIKAAKDILNMNQSVYADEDKGYYYNVCSNSCALMEIYMKKYI